MSNPKPAFLQGTATAEPATGGSALLWPEPAAPHDRHGAISRQLGNYSSYRSWVEKMKSSFDAGTPTTPTPGVRGR